MIKPDINEVSMKPSPEPSRFDLSKLIPSDMRTFLVNPTPENAGMIECRISREAHGSYSKMFPTYKVETEAGVFLMRGKKETTKTTSSHSITMSKDDVDKESNQFLAKLKGNFKSTEFIAYSTGLNPK